MSNFGVVISPSNLLDFVRGFLFEVSPCGLCACGGGSPYKVDSTPDPKEQEEFLVLQTPSPSSPPAPTELESSSTEIEPLSPSLDDVSVFVTLG